MIKRWLRLASVIGFAVAALWLLGRLLSGGPAAAAQGGVSGQASGDPSTTLLISALHIGATGWNDQDEGFQITNISTATLVLTETWRVRDQDSNVVAFPSTGVTLTPGASIWCAHNAISFTLAFGFTPSLEYGVDSSPAVPDMVLNSGLVLADTGDSLALFRIALIDTANQGSLVWWKGTNNPDASMERIDPTLGDASDNWATSVITTVGQDRNGLPLVGTPRYTNSVYVNSGASDPPAVVINEVAWMGTAGSDWDEWIELYNNTDQSIDMTAWSLVAGDGEPAIDLAGVIPAYGYFLLERSDIAVNNWTLAKPVVFQAK